jgi:hypothetical protein
MHSSADDTFDLSLTETNSSQFGNNMSTGEPGGLQKYKSKSTVRRQFLDSLSDDDTRDDDDGHEYFDNPSAQRDYGDFDLNNDNAHSTGFDNSKLLEDDGSGIFELSDEEDHNYEKKKELKNDRKSIFRAKRYQRRKKPSPETPLDSSNKSQTKNEDADVTPVRVEVSDVQKEITNILDDRSTGNASTSKSTNDSKNVQKYRDDENYSPFDALEEEDYQLPKDIDNEMVQRITQNYSPFDALEEEDYKLPTSFEQDDLNEGSNEGSNQSSLEDSNATMPISNLSQRQLVHNDFEMSRQSSVVPEESISDKGVTEPSTENGAAHQSFLSPVDYDDPSDDLADLIGAEGGDGDRTEGEDQRSFDPVNSQDNGIDSTFASQDSEDPFGENFSHEEPKTDFHDIKSDDSASHDSGNPFDDEIYGKKDFVETGDDFLSGSPRDEESNSIEPSASPKGEVLLNHGDATMIRKASLDPSEKESDVNSTSPSHVSDDLDIKDQESILDEPSIDSDDGLLVRATGHIESGLTSNHDNVSTPEYPDCHEDDEVASPLDSSTSRDRSETTKSQDSLQQNEKKEPSHQEGNEHIRVTKEKDVFMDSTLSFDDDDLFLENTQESPSDHSSLQQESNPSQEKANSVPDNNANFDEFAPHPAKIREQERIINTPQSEQNDSLDDLLREQAGRSNNVRVDLHASFNAHREENNGFDSAPPILESNSSLSSSSSKFGTSDVPVIETDDHEIGDNVEVYEEDDDVYGDESNIPYAIYSSARARVDPSNFGGNRLYNQGIQKQRKQAVFKKNEIQKRETKLDLATGSYVGRSKSNAVSHNDVTRDTSVYNRLYNTVKDKLVSKKSASSPARPRSGGTKKNDGSVFTRLYKPNTNMYGKDDGSTNAVQSVTRTTSRTRTRNTNGMTANERLYNLAKKKRVIEMEREKRRKTLEDEKMKSRSQSRSRKSPVAGQGNIFNRLYYLAQSKRDERERTLKLTREKKQMKEELQNNNTQIRSEREADEGFSRLYSKSILKQAEGRRLRESIEKKNAPRYITPSKKIKAEDATGIYNRGMVQKMQLEIKREEEGPMKNYVSPLLNPLIEDAPEQPRPRAQSVSGARSQPASSGLNRASSRIRSRSRIRAVSPSIPSQGPFSRTTPRPTSSDTRNNTPSTTRRNSTPKRLYNQSPIATRSKTPVSRSSRSYTPIKRKVGTPNTRTRSPTPSRVRESTPIRRQKQDSTRQLLRKLESDIHSSFKNVNDSAKKETDTIRTASTKGTSGSERTYPSDNEDGKHASSNAEAISFQYLTHARSSEEYPF